MQRPVNTDAETRQRRCSDLPTKPKSQLHVRKSAPILQNIIQKEQIVPNWGQFMTKNREIQLLESKKSPYITRFGISHDYRYLVIEVEILVDERNGQKIKYKAMPCISSISKIIRKLENRKAR